MSLIDTLVDKTQRSLQNSAWQVKYAAPNWRDKLTSLDPTEESKFLLWADKNQAPITDDYDMRGYWKSGAPNTVINQNDGLPHYPDTWKTPLHESFSGESVYANHRVKLPAWNNRDQLISPDGEILFDERKRK